MYFKRLEMHGFKSFAEPVVIEFHEGITCVVGPNGSGKSNISDAIRWVLGEQSPKTLRGGKMEEVIFAGTASRKLRGMAEVNLVIDNSSGILAIDYTEVSITRRMFRSGESEYLINNVPCRLKDIRELIMDTGIGVDGYSIIGQGKIAEIVSNKPESRREIFEEAAGVVSYKTKKAEAERRLEGTKLNLDRANDIIGEIEGRINGLKRDSEKAQEYLELKKDYTNLEINIMLRNMENIKSKEEVFQRDIQELGDQVKAKYEDRNKAEELLNQAQEENSRLELESNQRTNELLEIIERINNLTNKDKIKEEKISSIERDEERLSEELKALKDKILREESNKNQIEGQITETMEKLNEISHKLEKVSQDYVIFDLKYNKEKDEITEDQNLLFQLHKEISTKKAEISSIETLKTTLTTREEELYNEWDLTKENSQGTSAELNQIKHKYEETKIKYDNLKEELNQDLRKNNQDNRKLQTLREELQTLILQENKIRTRKHTIEEMEANYEGYNFGVKFIMRSQAKGIEGVVAELMKVPEGLETALETALGGALQNIVCTTDKDAKDAIELLKRNNGGRLTFLPMSSVKGREFFVPKEVESHEAYIGLGADLIQYHSAYEGIFKYLLGQVIIVKDLEGAINLSKLKLPGVRLVTLGGEIINSGGAITGGRYKNKTANLIERRSEVSKLEKELDYHKKEIYRNQEEEEKLKKSLHLLTEKIKENQRELNQIQVELSTGEEKIIFLQDRVNTNEAIKEKQEARLLSIKEDSQKSDDLLMSLKSDVEKAENQIATLSKKNEAATLSQEKIKKSLDKALEEVTGYKIDKNQWESKKENLSNIKYRIEQNLKELLQGESINKERLDKVKASKEELLFQGESEGSNLANLKGEKEKLEVLISEISEEKAKLNKDIGACSKELAELGSVINSLQDQKYQLEIKVAKQDAQMEGFNQRLWEEFDMSFAQAMDYKDADFAMSTSVKMSREVKNRLKELGDVNISSIEEYQTVEKRYNFLKEQREDILTAMEELEKIIREMSETIKIKFKENFDQVVENFEGIFKELFGGGYAELKMDDVNNPLESGIDIIAQPPGKKLQNINLMSGGEKTMTAIALMFAVLKAKPTPFCILDEVEAALDDGNIDRFSNYLKKFKDIQFVLVTHQKATMEHADVLYGVTMAEQGISNLLSLRLGDDFNL